jgi:hypothetical protein
VHAGAGVQQQVAGGQLDSVEAEAVFDDQLAAFVAVGLAQEQGAAQVRAQPLALAVLLRG